MNSRTYDIVIEVCENHLPLLNNILVLKNSLTAFFFFLFFVIKDLDDEHVVIVPEKLEAVRKEIDERLEENTYTAPEKGFNVIED